MNADMSEMRATMKQNRAARKAMADHRAMEEQKERENPLSGRGATPSMGLSQVRGGTKRLSNAEAQGKMLMEHLASLHGSGYAKQFHEGMKGAGFFGDLGIPIVSDVASVFGLGKQKKQKKKKEESDSESDDEMSGGFSFGDGAMSFLRGMTGNLSGQGQCGGLHTGRYEGEGAISAAEKKALKSVLAKHEMDGGAMFSKDQQDFSGHMKGGFLGMAMLALPLISKLLGAGKMSQEAHDAMKDMIEDHEKKYHSGKMKGGFMGLAMLALPLISKLLGAGHMTKGAADQLKRMMKKSEKMEGSGRAVGAGHCDGGRMGEPVPYGRPQRPYMELMDGGMSFGEMMKGKIPNLPSQAEMMEKMRKAGPGGINYDHAPTHDIEGNPVDKYGKPREGKRGINMLGKGKVKRVVGAGDGRRKRAEVVRKVMAEKGMKMIEASKYVKEHGLYKP
jgi:hypothetical protein